MTDPLSNDVSPKAISVLSFITVLVFLPLLVFAVYQTFTLLTRASGTPANIVVNAKSKLEPINTNFYHDFAQGGEEASDMLAPVLEQVKTLKPRYVRKDHLYDHYDVVHKSGDQLTFDWSQLDPVVNTILALNATPMLALSYMPSVIAKEGKVINPPNNWSDWSLVVQKTIEHYSGKSDKNIPNIIYEVWNEPDLDQFGKWQMTGEKNYLTLYHWAADGAGKAQNVNSFSLGGPVTTGLYKNWIIPLVTSGERVDFLSWHTYLSDPKRYNTDQINLATWLKPYPTFIIAPKYITEFGFTGNKSTNYGTSYAAAHAVAVIRQLISAHPAGLFTFQVKDGPNQQKGDGWGILTHETDGKRPKPRYFIYEFLDNMAGTRLNVTGEGSWVTSFASTNSNTTRILLVNFDSQGSHTEAVPITWTNLDDGNYTYRQHFMQGQDVTLQETVADGTLKKQVFMPAQSIVILELTKL